MTCCRRPSFGKLSTFFFSPCRTLNFSLIFVLSRWAEGREGREGWLSLQDAGIWGERGKLTFRSEGERVCLYTKNSRICKHFYSSHFSVCLVNKYLSYTTLSCYPSLFSYVSQSLQILQQGALGWPMPPDRPQLCAVMGSGVWAKVSFCTGGVCQDCCTPGWDDWVCDSKAYVGPQCHQNLAHQLLRNHVISAPLTRPPWMEDRTAGPWLYHLPLNTPRHIPIREDLL